MAGGRWVCPIFLSICTIIYLGATIGIPLVVGGMVRDLTLVGHGGTTIKVDLNASTTESGTVATGDTKLFRYDYPLPASGASTALKDITGAAVEVCVGAGSGPNVGYLLATGADQPSTNPDHFDRYVIISDDPTYNGTCANVTVCSNLRTAWVRVLDLNGTTPSSSSSSLSLSPFAFTVDVAQTNDANEQCVTANFFIRFIVGSGLLVVAIVLGIFTLCWFFPCCCCIMSARSNSRMARYEILQEETTHYGATNTINRTV
jgi:hypothetical protein